MGQARGVSRVARKLQTLRRFTPQVPKRVSQLCPFNGHILSTESLRLRTTEEGLGENFRINVPGVPLSETWSILLVMPDPPDQDERRHKYRRF